LRMFSDMPPPIVPSPMKPTVISYCLLVTGAFERNVRQHAHNR